MTDLLRLDGVTVADSSGQEIVQKLDLSVAPGEFAALVGESGSGKSMAARAILRLLPPGLSQRSGRIWFQGEDLSVLGAAGMRHIRGTGIAMVFQEPMTALNPAMTVGAQVAEGLTLHDGLRGAALERAVVDMLDRVGIPDAKTRAGRWPHEFSGGMRQRIVLTCAMAMRPKLLIADEPTTALDTLTQADVMTLLTDLTQEGGAAVLLISHDLGLVGRYAQTAHVLQNGQRVESGPTARILSRPAHAYTRRLVEALPRPKPPTPIPDESAPVAAVQDISLRYDSEGWLRRKRGALVLQQLSMRIQRGEVVALVGGSGSGKSTLGRALLRLTDVASGQVFFDGQDITRARRGSLADLRARAQLIHQDPYDSLDPRMTVSAIVAEPLLRLRLSSGEKRDRVAKGLARVGLGGTGNRFPHELSGGQRQRVSIARALIGNPAFVVADEPVSALDMTVQRQVIALLADLQREQGFACLFISHDFGAVMEIADRIAVLERGRIVEEGPAHQVYRQPQSDYTRRLIAGVPTLGTQEAV